MKKTIKLLSFLFILTFAFTSCGDSDKKCKEDCKKECKKECSDSKDKEACKADCKKECCTDKDKEACEPGCEKECCADKAEATDSTATTEVTGEEQAHTCTQACQDDPHSCPNHKH